MAKAKKKIAAEPLPAGAVVPRGTVSAAFQAWLDERKIALTVEAFAMIDDAISEMAELRGALFTDWWMRNHYRYTKLREIDRAKARQAALRFLADVQLRKVKL